MLVLRNDLEKNKKRSIHQVHKLGDHKEDVKMLEIWPDFERVGQDTG